MNETQKGSTLVNIAIIRVTFLPSSSLRFSSLTLTPRQTEHNTTQFLTTHLSSLPFSPILSLCPNPKAKTLPLGLGLGFPYPIPPLNSLSNASTTPNSPLHPAMYGSMNVPDQIPDAEENGGAAPDSVDNHHHHIHYNSHGLDDGAGGVVDDVSADTVYVSGGGAPDMSIQPCEDSSQLTLSFRGQVYVFDSVTPEKVQAVLLLLGGCEMPSSGSQCAEMSPQNQRGAIEFPARCDQPHRAASLSRFRQKRKERCFDKKVRYSVRQEVALRMQRNKGQFTSAKKYDGGNSCGSDQESVQDAVQSETSCTHCGISSKSTPMMRRGPSGPRSLCNACGLFWSNRGTLRDLSKRSQEHALAPPEQVGEGNNSDGQTAIPGNNSVATFSENDNAALALDR